jgi:hypothetical protein
MWTRAFVTSFGGRLVVAGSVVMAVLAAPPQAAGQGGVLTTTPTKAVTEIKTGLLAFLTGAGRSAEVLITELNPRATSAVRVTFFNEANQAVFKEDAVLHRGQPVHVVLPLDMPVRRVNLRLLVTLTRDPLARSLPVMVLEDVDTGSFAIEDRVSCAPPEDKDGATPYCPPPAMVRTFTAN